MTYSSAEGVLWKACRHTPATPLSLPEHEVTYLIELVHGKKALRFRTPLLSREARLAAVLSFRLTPRQLERISDLTHLFANSRSLCEAFLSHPDLTWKSAAYFLVPVLQYTAGRDFPQKGQELLEPLASYTPATRRVQGLLAENPLMDITHAISLLEVSMDLSEPDYEIYLQLCKDEGIIQQRSMFAQEFKHTCAHVREVAQALQSVQYH